MESARGSGTDSGVDSRAGAAQDAQAHPTKTVDVLNLSDRNGPDRDNGHTADVARVSSAVDQLLATHPPETTAEKEFLEQQFNRGLAWVSFPTGRGGLAAPSGLQRNVNARLARAGAPTLPDKSFIGYGMAAPTLIAHGSDAQLDRYLRKIFTGDDIWCQLFSEPGAGSDLASLSTRAVRDGARWVVNGQKVWSTQAHQADFGLLLARTDTDKPKHKGITLFVLDMRSPGVDVRPLRQLTGEAEFNEVFFADVVVPDENRVGPVGDGWRVAMSTLVNERAAIGGEGKSPYAVVIPKLLEVWKQRSGVAPGGAKAIQRDRVTQLWCAARALRLAERRATELQEANQPGPVGSILKLMTAEVTLSATELAVDLLGAYGTLYPSGYAMRQPDELMRYENPQQFFLRCRSVSIGGGTTEVQRNIIAERVLGLPRDPGSDGEVPWSQVPR